MTANNNSRDKEVRGGGMGGPQWHTFTGRALEMSFLFKKPFRRHKRLCREEENHLDYECPHGRLLHTAET